MVQKSIAAPRLKTGMEGIFSGAANEKAAGIAAKFSIKPRAKNDAP
nr:hypothetical protein [Klebsiella pneumoniae]